MRQHGLYALVALALLAPGCAKAPANVAPRPLAPAMAQAKGAVAAQIKRDIEEILEDTDGNVEYEVIWLTAKWSDKPGVVEFNAEADKTEGFQQTAIVIRGTYDVKAQQVLEREEEEDTRRGHR